MGTILEALAVIKGKDATGNAFDTVAQKIARVARAANALNRDVQKQINIAGAAERSATRLQRGSMAIGSGAKAAAGAIAAYEGSRAVHAIAEHTAKAAADRAHEEVRMRASGMSPEEISDAGKLAAEVSKKYKSVSQTEIMHTARNVRAVVGTFEEASKIIDPLMQLRVVAMGAHPEHAEELGEDFDKLVKGMEIKGVTQDLGKFNHYIDGMAKAINVFGDTLRPTDYYEMFKYGRASTNAWSDEFMLTTAPTLAQRLGGSSAGKALSSFYTQFVGGKMSNKAVEELQKYDLLDPDKVIKTTTGHVKGVMPGGIVGGEYLQPGHADAYQWVNKVLLPHLAAKGVTDPSKISEVMAALSSQAVTAQLLELFSTQQSAIEKDRALTKGAKGKEAAADFQANDPKIIQKSIGAQFDNYLGNTATPFVPAANAGMNWLASGLSYMGDRARADPLRSATELGYGAMLMTALGIDSTRSFFGNAGSLFRGEGLSGFKLGMTRLTAMLAPILDIATRADVMAPSESLKRLAGMHADKFDALSDLDRDDALLPNVREGSWLGQKIAEKKAEHAAERARIEGELTDLGFAGPGVPGRGLYAGQYTIDDIRKATGIGTAEPVEAKVVGEATLKTEVTISPSANFLAQIRQEVQNGINAFRSSGKPATGTAGSTGGSMPEAGPPH